MTALACALVLLAQAPQSTDADAEWSAPAPTAPKPGPPPPSAAPATTAPPLVPTDAAAPTGGPPAAEVTAPAAPEPTYSNALNIPMLGLFALHLGAEVEHAFGQRFSGFASLGVGGLLSLDANVGARLYVTGKVFEGLFFDAAADFFAMPGAGLALLGPQVGFGVVWRRNNVVFGIGLGVGMTISLRHAAESSPLGAVVDADVVLIPGLQQPRLHGVAFAPSLRVMLGPAF